MQFVLVDSQVVESYVKVAAVHALIAVDESLRASADFALGMRAIRGSGLELGPAVSSCTLHRRDLFWRRYCALYRSFVAFREFKVYPLESDRRPLVGFTLPLVGSSGADVCAVGVGRGSKIGRVRVRVVLVVDTLVQGNRDSNL